MVQDQLCGGDAEGAAGTCSGWWTSVCMKAILLGTGGAESVRAIPGHPAGTAAWLLESVFAAHQLTHYPAGAKMPGRGETITLLSAAALAPAVLSVCFV